MRRYVSRLLSSSVVVLVIGCAPTAAPPPSTPTLVPPTPTAVPRPASTPTPPTRPTPTLAPSNLKSFHTNISFETYETEETIALELDQLPGVASVNVTQLDITVEYDPTRLSEDDILRTLRNNPEVRIMDDHPGQ